MLAANAKHKLAGKVTFNQTDKLNTLAQHTVSKAAELFPISLHAFVGCPSLLSA